MRRLLFALGLVLSLVAPVALPAHAQGVTVEINIGTNLNNGRSITCREGEGLLRNRGFWDIRRVDCRGRFFIYRARRATGLFEIGLRARDGRVVDLRRIRR